MATEKRLIDAKIAMSFLKEAKVKETGMFSRGINKGLNVALSALGNRETIPTVDAVEVVRCKDCKHWKRCYKMTKPNELSLCGSCGLINMDIYMNEGDFCSYGERRTDG